MLKVVGKRIVVALLLILLAVGAAFGFIWWQNSQYEDYGVVRGDLKTFVASNGEIKAEKVANLEYNSAGWISELPVKENEIVEEGQIVARIDPTEAVKNLAAAEASHRSAKAALNNVIDNIHQFQYGNGGYDNVGSLNETQTQKTQRQQAEEAVNIAYDDLQKARYATSRTVLRAPFSGMVTKVAAELNEATSAFSSEPIIQIVDFSTLYFEAEIDQQRSGLIEASQSATVTLEALKEPLKGTVYEIASSTKTTAEGDVVVPVKIKIDSPERLKLGWEGDVQVDLETLSGALLLPKQAVEYVNGQSTVRIKDGLLTKTKPVVLGEFDGVNWQVVEGLTEGETVLIKKHS